MIQCRAQVLLIDCGNDGENEKPDADDSGEDHCDITMECDFVLKYAGTDEGQLVMLSEIDYKGLCDETNNEQEFYGL